MSEVDFLQKIAMLGLKLQHKHLGPTEMSPGGVDLAFDSLCGDGSLGISWSDNRCHGGAPGVDLRI